VSATIAQRPACTRARQACSCSSAVARGAPVSCRSSDRLGLKACTPRASAACSALVQAGRCAMVALTLGADGALLVTAQGAWRADALPVPVAGTVGAGDSFVGAWACALVRGDAPDEQLRQAVAASAATVQAGGTALCDPARVRELAPQVRVRAGPAALPP
ncbi:MAG: hypothetical protein EOO24_51150, partial [Comamonadaceae bacterium]